MARGHQDKVAVITGAANGIGQAFAARLADDGVHIAAVDLLEQARLPIVAGLEGKNVLEEVDPGRAQGTRELRDLLAVLPGV